MPKKKENLNTIAYNAIKEKIISCEYEPSTLINADLICEELQMSRTPVRDALGRLESERLVEVLPKKGIMVSSLNLNDIGMVYECRMILEPYIIENYCKNLPHDILDKMQESIVQEEKCIQNRDSNIYYYDDQFHSLMMRACPNFYLKKQLEDIADQNARIRVLVGRSSSDRLKNTLQEHKGILEALIRNDSKDAAEMMRIHLVQAREASYGSLIHRSNGIINVI